MQARTVAELGVPYVMMHTRGLPTEMTALASYSDLRAEVRSELSQRCLAVHAAGVPPWLLVADPGIGFAKTAEHNLSLLHEGLRGFIADLAAPSACLAGATLVGASRKGFIGKILAQPDPMRRQWGNAATVCAAVAGVSNSHCMQFK